MLNQLIVLDDEEGFKFLFEHHLEDLIQSEKLQLSFCINRSQALNALDIECSNKILLCDLVLPGDDGLKFAQLAKLKYPQIKVLIMSGLEPSTDEFPYFSKPIDFDALRGEILGGISQVF